MRLQKEKTKEEILNEYVKGDIERDNLYGSSIHIHTALKAMEAYAKQKLSALQASQNISSKELSEKATIRAREIYPMANEDDYPENPNVNRLNRACVGAFVNGFDYARKLLSESSPAKEVEKPDFGHTPGPWWY